MTGLVLKLRPFEKLLVNGAVLQNGPRAARLRVRTADASVLRLRDALRPDEADTTARRIYYIAQLAVAGEADAAEAAAEILILIDAVAVGGLTPAQIDAYARARTAAEAGRPYSVMRAVRPLLGEDAAPSEG